MSVCSWRYDFDLDFYDTACGHTFFFANGYLGDEEFVYCPFCGRKAVDERELKEWADELTKACGDAGIEHDMVPMLVEALVMEPRDERTAEEVVRDEIESWNVGE